MSKLKLAFLLFIALGGTLVGFAQKHALACELISYSNYIEISPNTFVSPSFNFDNKEKLLSIINKGKARVSTTFGHMISEPKVVITTNDKESARFGSNAYGKALLTPLGQCLIFGSKGQNIDVIAHEYTHAEVHYRVGWLDHWLKVPVWFNEGVALLVDFRKPYLLENIDLSQAEVDLVKKSEFDFSINSYKAARVLVDGIDKPKLYRNLAKIKQGQDINSVFSL